MGHKLLFGVKVALMCVVLLIASGAVNPAILRSLGVSSLQVAQAEGITQRIQFAPGATSAQVSGQIDGFGLDTYLLRAFAGQRMQLLVASPASNVYLTVVSPGGSPLARAQNGTQSFDSILPESGDYTLQISAPAGTPMTTYLMTVAVTGALPPASTGRIQFAPGATSAQVTGQASGTIITSYLLNARAGQFMKVVLVTFGNPLYLSVVSPGGSPLARAQAGAQSFAGFLPENGDYSLRVSGAPGTPLTNFILITSVTNGATNVTPQRIQFALDATSAQITGQIDGTSIDTYLLNAQAGQSMQLLVTSPASNVYLTLVSPGGSPLARAQAGAQSFNGTLPESGDYTLQISAPAGSLQTAYTLDIVINGTPSGGITQRIQFAPGGTSAQRSGQISGNTLDTYLLNAQAGQFMQVFVSSPASNVYLTVVSPGGSPLARAQAGAQNFNGTLPESGDYTLQVSAPAGTSLTSYVLSVSVTGSLSGGGGTQRIQFAPGGTSAQRSGQVSGTTMTTYLLNARAGQFMQVFVSSPASNVYLTVVSPFGSPLARAQAGAQSFSGTLPESGDYTLQVSAPAGTALTTYILSVSVTG